MKWAYYNDNDPNICAWLRELIREKLITDGEVDNRSIIDVKADDLKRFRRVHLFAGIAGWEYALRLAGWGDAVWTVSCPCQPFSDAGKGMAEDDERHLWPFVRNLIGQCLPPVVIGEQVASALGRRWLAGVSADMERLAYPFVASDLCAAGVASPHIRQRLYWMAHAPGEQRFKRVSLIGSLAQPPSVDAAIASDADRMAKSNGEGCERQTEHEGRISRPIVATGKGGTSRMAEREQPRSQGHTGNGDQPESRRNGQGPVRSVGSSGASGWMCNTEHVRCDEGIAGDGRGQASARSECGKKSDRPDATSGVAHAGHTTGCTERPESLQERGAGIGQSSPWSNYRIIQCRDGNARRVPVEPSLFPLVARIPRSVGGGGRKGEGRKIGRVSLLRGSGNSIVPQLAAQFICAFREALLDMNKTEA